MGTPKWIGDMEDAVEAWLWSLRLQSLSEDPGFRAALADAGLTVECRRWMPYYENRLLPMPLEYA